MSKRQREDKQVVFRRIGGRVVPIAVGAGIAGEALRRRQLGKSALGTVTATRGLFGKETIRMKKFGMTTGMFTFQKVKKRRAKVGIVYGTDPATSGMVIREAAKTARARGVRSFVGTVVSPDIVDLAKRRNTRFVGMYKRSGSKIISPTRAKAEIRRTLTIFKKHGRKKSYKYFRGAVMSVTRLPKLKAPRARIGYGGKLQIAAGLGLAAAGAAGVFTKE